MARKATKTSNSNVVIVGFDAGYGVTKAVTPQKAISFPSVMGHAREISFKPDEIARKYPGMQLHDGGDSLFVGDLALSQLRPYEQRRLRGRTANETEIGNEFRRRLLLVALGQLIDNVPDGERVDVRISTGLPVSHMRDSADLKASLMGPHVVRTDQSAFVANVVGVSVMPQPQGAIYSEFLGASGQPNPCYTFIRTAVLDIGTYTVDVAVDDGGEYIEAQSGSVEAGIHTAQETVSALVESRYREKPGYRQVEELLRTGYFSAFGNKEDFRREVQNALKPLQEAVVNIATDKLQSGVAVDVIWVAGGGAPFVIDKLSSLFTHAKMLQEPHLANARGFLKYALFDNDN